MVKMSTTFLPIAKEKDRPRNSRRLTYQRLGLGGYKPLTDITDHAKIDHDQAYIENMKVADRVEEAHIMYSKGGFSQSVARMQLVAPEVPLMAIPEGTRIVGNTKNGEIVKGMLMETIIWSTHEDQVEILVEYEVARNQTIFCYMGGLASTNAHEIDGCFATEGTLKILDFQQGAPVYEYDYIYDPVLDTYNERSMENLSTKIDWSFGSSKHFEKFEQYYGAGSYANDWVEAALNGNATSFSNGNADFSDLDPNVRKDVLLSAPKALNLWMYVVRMMEYAVARCDVNCGGSAGDRCDDIPVRAWDQSVASYIGSLQGEDGQGKGFLLYDLADNMCATFKTCSADGSSLSGTSFVNLRVIDLFRDGQLAVLRRDCRRADVIKDQIVTLMTIPLIQASLYFGHVRNLTNNLEEIQTATYAASVLPFVNKCSPDDANVIYENLGFGKTSTVDIVAVKYAFENAYACVGVTCEDIGGVWEGSYYGQYSVPCNYKGDSKAPMSLGIIVVLCFVIVPCALFWVFIWYKKRISRHSFNQTESVNIDFPEHTMD